MFDWSHLNERGSHILLFNYHCYMPSYGHIYCINCQIQMSFHLSIRYRSHPHRHISYSYTDAHSCSFSFTRICVAVSFFFSFLNFVFILLLISLNVKCAAGSYSDRIHLHAINIETIWLVLTRGARVCWKRKKKREPKEKTHSKASYWPWGSEKNIYNTRNNASAFAENLCATCKICSNIEQRESVRFRRPRKS